MSTAITRGSIGELAQKNNTSIAESFLSAECVIIVDVSGSMAMNDSRSGKSRYDVALEELGSLQKNMPGKVAIIAFSDDTLFVPGGIPPFLGAGTALHRALEFAKMADVPGITFFVISDGEPDDEKEALRIARTYQNKINVVYVGPERSPYGRDFLTQLAQVSGGKTVTADRAMELAAGVTLLLEG